MKSFVTTYPVKVLSLIFLFLAFLMMPGFAEEPAFKSPAAIKAKERYQQSVGAVSKRFINELDRNLQFSMQAGQLEEANQIQKAKKQAAAGGPVAVDFKRPSLIASRNSYRDGFVAAKGQYYRDLEPALREATKAGDLQDANMIDTVLKALAVELADGKITGKVSNGLWLSIGGKRTLWENETVTLPSNKTPVVMEGVLLLSGKVRSVKLRSASPSGSERLKFTVDGKLREFQMEGNHRYVVAEPQPGADKMRLRLGDSIAANEWSFGPLEWSINDGKWREIPQQSLIAVD